MLSVKKKTDGVTYARPSHRTGPLIPNLIAVSTCPTNEILTYQAFSGQHHQGNLSQGPSLSPPKEDEVIYTL